MKAKNAKLLIDRALEFEALRLALKIANTPEEKFSPQMPEIVELRQLAKSIDLENDTAA